MKFTFNSKRFYDGYFDLYYINYRLYFFIANNFNRKYDLKNSSHFCVILLPTKTAAYSISVSNNSFN